MSSIDIPDNMKFTTWIEIHNPGREERRRVSLCFGHAVKAVMLGREVETSLTYDWCSCAVCEGEVKLDA